MTTIASLRAETHRPVILADNQGVVSSVNAAFEKTFGWRSADLVGRPITAIIPNKLRDAHHLGLSRFLTTGQSTLLGRELDLEMVDGQGNTIPARHLIIAGQEEGAWVFGAIIDIRSTQSGPEAGSP